MRLMKSAIAALGMVIAVLAAPAAHAERLAISEYGKITSSLPWAVAFKKGYLSQDGLDITEIVSSAGGGGVLANAGTTLTNCVFTSNNAGEWGDGINSNVGATLTLSGSTYSVAEVFSGTAAATKGVGVGDVIVAIAGQTLASLTLSEVAVLAGGKVGSTKSEQFGAAETLADKTLSFTMTDLLPLPQ